MLNGVVFDINEFAVHDGPGLRTTVFMKGCPLRCAWCHNPESVCASPETMKTEMGSRTVGQMYTVAELAERLNKQAEILRANGGGITFSGGEPLMHAGFLLGVMESLDHLHVLLDTSGYAEESVFLSVAKRCDMVYFDLKLMEPAAHRRWTGQRNELIQKNLERLDETGVPFYIRVPLVPRITDTPENLAAIAECVRSLRNVGGVHLLPYNTAAGGKYRACGREFTLFEQESLPINFDLKYFEEVGVPVQVM